MRKEVLKYLYNLVFCQTISDSGKYLFLGNRFGDIFCQKIEDFENVEDDKPKTRVRIYPQGENHSIDSLAFHRDFLIVGTAGCVYGLKWDEENSKLSSSKKWEVQIPLTSESIEQADVNSMWLDKAHDILYVGCGDNNMYSINLEDGKIVRTFSGHEDYINTVCGCDGKLFTSSEDGCVRIWLPSEKNSVGKIEPYTNSKLVRPDFGNWIGGLAVSSDWLLCGGGTRLSLWHMRSMTCSTDYSFEGAIHCADFVDENVLVAGEHTSVQHYTLNGELVADIPVEHTATYSIVWQNQPFKFMSMAGYSNKLHVLTDFRFLDTSVDLYEEVEDDFYTDE